MPLKSKKDCIEFYKNLVMKNFTYCNTRDELFNNIFIQFHKENIINYL